MIFFGQISSSSHDESFGLFSVMQKGGPLMWLILLGSVIALGVFIERLIYYRRCNLKVGEFLTGILSLLKGRRYDEALERCDEGFGPVVHVVRTAIIKRSYSPAELREITRETAQLEVPRLEAHLSLLSTIGYIAPLIGLLGTVTGMIEAFLQINRLGSAASVGELSNGIWTALLTTAAGLAVAIPSYVAYNYLVTRLNSIIADLERAGIEVIHVLTDANVGEHSIAAENRENRTTAPATTSADAS